MDYFGIKSEIRDGWFRICENEKRMISAIRNRRQMISDIRKCMQRPKSSVSHFRMILAISFQRWMISAIRNKRQMISDIRKWETYDVEHPKQRFRRADHKVIERFRVCCQNNTFKAFIHSLVRTVRNHPYTPTLRTHPNTQPMKPLFLEAGSIEGE